MLYCCLFNLDCLGLIFRNVNTNSIPREQLCFRRHISISCQSMYGTWVFSVTQESVSHAFVWAFLIYVWACFTQVYMCVSYVWMWPLHAYLYEHTLCMCVWRRLSFFYISISCVWVFRVCVWKFQMWIYNVWYVFV